MSKPLRYALLALALFGLWKLFGDRLAPIGETWMAPIEQAETSDERGDPDAVTDPSAPRDAEPGPRRGRITDGIREKVTRDLERGARRNGP